MTIEGINLLEWLREHSDSVQENGAEIIFTHFTKETSILVRRDASVISYHEPRSQPLRDFYQEYAAASIGNSMLMLASILPGGTRLSEGYSIPDFKQLKTQALQLEVPLDKADEVFMVGSAGMFYYAYNPSLESPKLRCYDRDFNTVDEDQTFADVLGNWWQLLLDDAL